MKRILYKNAIIHTMESETATAESMLVENGYISALNVTDAKGAKVVDLKGQHVYPCMIDGHTHLLPTVVLAGNGFEIAGADEDTIIEETEVPQESAEGDTDALKAFGGSRIGLGIGFSYDIYNIKPEYLSEFNYCLQLYRQSPRDAINYMADSSTFIDTCYYLGIANK